MLQLRMGIRKEHLRRWRDMTLVHERLHGAGAQIQSPEEPATGSSPVRATQVDDILLSFPVDVMISVGGIWGASPIKAHGREQALRAKVVMNPRHVSRPLCKNYQHARLHVYEHLRALPHLHEHLDARLHQHPHQNISQLCPRSTSELDRGSEGRPPGVNNLSTNIS